MSSSRWSRNENTGALQEERLTRRGIPADSTRDEAATISIREREYAPVDRVAARVVGRGYQYAPDKQLSQGQIWDAPPPCVPPPPEIADLTGTTRGRLRIYGYLRRTAAGNHKWLAKCACGKYQMRDGRTWRRAIRNPDDPGDACDFCQHAAYLRRADEFHRTGTNTTDRLLLK